VHLVPFRTKFPREFSSETLNPKRFVFVALWKYLSSSHVARRGSRSTRDNKRKEREIGEIHEEEEEEEKEGFS